MRSPNGHGRIELLPSPGMTAPGLDYGRLATDDAASGSTGFADVPRESDSISES